MLGRDRAYEARIADLKEAHEATVRALKLTIDALAEQVEYLRAVGGRSQPVRLGVNVDPMTPPEAPALYTGVRMSEEEEDLRAMHENNILDAETLQAALADLGIDT